jgi:hypothetical protein
LPSFTLGALSLSGMPDQKLRMTVPRLKSRFGCTVSFQRATLCAQVPATR